ncbi:13096_t:CDS:2 [Cetraspora pellucida]|uniref:13096_t:CDS:1 n=1 Tax=Cetraspora pellucida TaxID=1433469 RepID=A0ACA9K199_9GLOM|nr:13096_t:CDS:2 [Cetraspora pellucida]
MDEDNYFNNNYYLSIDDNNYFEIEAINTPNEFFTTTTSEISNVTKILNTTKISNTSKTLNTLEIIDETFNASNNLRAWILEWIILEDFLFTIVEDQFKTIIEKITKFYIVSADTIKCDLITKYIEMQTNIQTELQEISGKFAFSLDIWTSSVIKAYMRIIIHFIDKDWWFQQKTLDFVKIEGSHIGENFTNELIKVFEFYNIESKTIGKDISFSTNNHFYCFAHIVNLSVQAALKQLKDEIDKVRNLIIKSHSSLQWHQKFLEILDLNNIKNLSSILNVLTSTQDENNDDDLFSVSKHFCNDDGHNELNAYLDSSSELVTFERNRLESSTIQAIICLKSV